MKRIGKMGREAGGIVKEPSLVSIVAACWTENVDSCARQQLSMIVQANIGRIFNTTLTSSTCCSEHSSAGCAGLLLAALLRHLRLFVRPCVVSAALALFSSDSLFWLELVGLVFMLITALLGLGDKHLLSAEATKTCETS